MSEREKQVSDINTYMWSREKQYRWTYLQDRNRDADVEKGHVDTKGGRRRGIHWESNIDRYTLPCVTQTDNGKFSITQGAHRALRWSRRMAWGGGGPVGEGDIGILIADSH